MIYYGIETYYNSLAHHGVKGMKWGIRKPLMQYGERVRKNTNALARRQRDGKKNRVYRSYSDAVSRRKAANKSIGKRVLKSAAYTVGATAAAYLLSKSSMKNMGNIMSATGDRRLVEAGKMTAKTLLATGLAVSTVVSKVNMGIGAGKLVGNTINRHTGKREFYGYNNSKSGKADVSYASVHKRKSSNAAARYTY